MLLTLKGRECLGIADVVVYDYLSNPVFLGYVKEGAEILCAGKKAGRHTLSQPEINALLVERTKQGKTVVRLKGGDPFLFGRGGEEAVALAEAGCAFEVVPGVTSAIAAAAYAGIPVTHRDHNTILTIFTGHEDPSKPETSVDFAAVARAPGTKVMLMGIKRLEFIADGLMAAGMDKDVPVALIRWATTGRQQTLAGKLRDIAAKAAAADFQPPAVAVFGEVVDLRAKLNWFEALPLFGKRIAVTRTRHQAGDLVSRLRALGAEAFEMPTIRLEPAPDKRLFYETVAYSHAYDWGRCIFQSLLRDLPRRPRFGSRADRCRRSRDRRESRLVSPASRCAGGKICRGGPHQSAPKRNQRGEPEDPAGAGGGRPRCAGHRAHPPRGDCR